GILFVIAMVFLLIAGVLLYQMFFPNNTPVLKMQAVNKEDNSIKWDVLREINPDIVGWLSIEGTNIDTPVVQTTDNDKYLYTAFDGSSDERGTPFLDKDYTFDGQSRNSVIYGHSTMRSRVHVMFDDLLVYVDDPSFINEHKIIKYNRPPELGGDSRWEIFSILVQESDFDYRQMIFENDEQFINYYASIKENSRVQTNVDIQPGDEILTLSTCIFNVGLNDGRLAVIAKKINE
ncbi:MAG: class B sortase, partial [Eubacterium sp.]